MSQVFSIRPAAARDIRQAVDWYNGQLDGLGREFAISVRNGFSRIREQPHPTMKNHFLVFLLGLFAACSFGQKTSAGPSLDLSAENGILLKDAQPYRGIGVNYFDLFYRALKNPTDTSYDDGLKQLSDAGIPFVRFMACGFWPVDWELYLTDKEAYFARLDAIVQSAETHNIGLIPSLFWHMPTVPDLVGEPMNALGDPDSKTCGFIRQYTTEAVTRYNDSPAIWGWEFGNEYNLHVDLPNASTHRPKIVPQLGTPTERTERDELSSTDMLVAFNEFAKTVRSIDPHRILITGNSRPRPSAHHNTAEKSWKKDNREQWTQIVKRDNPEPFNTISVHIYPVEKNAMAAGAKDISDLIRILQEIASEAGKPLFIGEFGAPKTLGSEEEKTAFAKILTAIETHKVPLAALWVYDYKRQNADWNTTFENDRAYMLKMIGEANR